MAQSHGQPGADYSPEMDAETHEKTYDGFVEFTTITTLVVLCWVLALAMGGIKGAWLMAIMFVVLSGAAGALGAFSRMISWKAPGAVFGLMILAFIVL